MARHDADFSGSLPGLYERYLVPLLFTPYADDIAERVRAVGARHVLEIAAGTGIVTRALARTLPAAEIVATDLNEGMVGFARRPAPPNVRWLTADAMALPFEDGRFDTVLCQFGVMFFPDRPRAFREARRVLTAGGTYLFSVWDSLEHNEIPRIVSDAAAAAFPEDPPTFIRRTPYGHGDPAAIERELRAAGFLEVAWESVAKRSRGPSARDVAIGFCEGTPLRHDITARDPQRLADVVDAVTEALRASLGTGAIEGGMRAFVFSAR